MYFDVDLGESRLNVEVLGSVDYLNSFDLVPYPSSYISLLKHFSVYVVTKRKERKLSLKNKF
jgi:hypothetical protein